MRFVIAKGAELVITRQSAKEPCAYCGAQPAATRDHVLPLCLFTSPVPLKMLTVPACWQCNERKSKNDEYLRDLLAFDIACCEHPVAQELMKGKITRSMRRGRCAFANRAVRNARRVWLQTPTGIYFDHAYSIPLQVERIDEIFTTIARGIYYKLAGARFPDGYEFEVRRVLPRNAGLVFEILKEAGLRGPYRVGNVFGCLFAYWGKDPGVAKWLMWFYDGFFVTVSTRRRGSSCDGSQT